MAIVILVVSIPCHSAKVRRKNFELAYDPLYQWLSPSFDIFGKSMAFGPVAWLMSEKQTEYSSAVTDNTSIELEALGYGARLSFFLSGTSISEGWIIALMGAYFPKISVEYKEETSGNLYKGEDSGSIYAIMLEHSWAWEFLFIRGGLMLATWDGPVAIELDQVNGAGAATAFLVGLPNTNDPQPVGTVQVGIVF